MRRLTSHRPKTTLPCPVDYLVDGREDVLCWEGRRGRCGGHRCQLPSLPPFLFSYSDRLQYDTTSSSDCSHCASSTKKLDSPAPFFGCIKLS